MNQINEPKLTCQTHFNGNSDIRFEQNSSYNNENLKTKHADRWKAPVYHMA